MTEETPSQEVPPSPVADPNELSQDDLTKVAGGGLPGPLPMPAFMPEPLPMPIGNMPGPLPKPLERIRLIRR